MPRAVAKLTQHPEPHAQIALGLGLGLGLELTAASRAPREDLVRVGEREGMAGATRERDDLERAPASADQPRACLEQLVLVVRAFRHLSVRSRQQKVDLRSR